MVLKIVINSVLKITSILFLINFSLSAQDLKKENVFIYYHDEHELEFVSVIDTVSLKLINSLNVLSYDEFIKYDTEKRKELIKEQKEAKILIIYNTNDLFNIFLVKEIINDKFVIMKGEYKEFIE